MSLAKHLLPAALLALTVTAATAEPAGAPPAAPVAAESGHDHGDMKMADAPAAATEDPKKSGCGHMHRMRIPKGGCHGKAAKKPAAGTKPAP